MRNRCVSSVAHCGESRRACGLRPKSHHCRRWVSRSKPPHRTTTKISATMKQRKRLAFGIFESERDLGTLKNCEGDVKIRQLGHQHEHVRTGVGACQRRRHRRSSLHVHVPKPVKNLVVGVMSQTYLFLMIGGDSQLTMWTTRKPTQAFCRTRFNVKLNSIESAGCILLRPIFFFSTACGKRLSGISAVRRPAKLMNVP